MLNLKMYFIVFISTHMMSKESLDRLNNLDNVFIMEDMVLADLKNNINNNKWKKWSLPTLIGWCLALVPHTRAYLLI